MVMSIPPEEHLMLEMASHLVTEHGWTNATMRTRCADVIAGPTWNIVTTLMVCDTQLGCRWCPHDPEITALCPYFVPSTRDCTLPAGPPNCPYLMSMVS